MIPPMISEPIGIEIPPSVPLAFNEQSNLHFISFILQFLLLESLIYAGVA